MPAGPGSWHGLGETIDSIEVYEDDDVKVVVMDDWTVDCRAPRVQARWPEVDVVRPPSPSPNAFLLFPALAAAMRGILDRYDFEVLCKIDADALVTAPGLIRGAIARLEADPSLGQLGCCRVHASGVPRDTFYERFAWTVTGRWSPRTRRLLRSIEAQGLDPLDSAQGGVYCVSRRALEVARVQGWLDWRDPPGSLLGEDFLMSGIVQASGFRIASWGGPKDPIATTSRQLPLSLNDIVAQDKLAVHPVRRGLNGESEDEVRAFFRERREEARRGVTSGGRP